MARRGNPATNKKARAAAGRHKAVAKRAKSKGCPLDWSKKGDGHVGTCQNKRCNAVLSVGPNSTPQLSQKCRGQSRKGQAA